MPRAWRYRGHVRTVPPVADPISAADMEAVLGLASGADTALLEDMISTATEIAETYLGAALMAQTWVMSLDRWQPLASDDFTPGAFEMPVSEVLAPGGGYVLTLPRWPLQSVDAVSVFAADDSETVIDVDGTFEVDTASRPGRMAVRSGAGGWPQPGRSLGGIRLTYTAGYPDAGSIPRAILIALKHIAAHLYTHRGDGCSADDALAGSGAQTMLRQHVLWDYRL